MVKAAVETVTTPAGPDDARTSTQRRTDALVELCRRQLDSGALPTTAGERPHLTVVTTLETIEERLGGVGETPDGTILSGDTVRRLACDAKITRLIVGPTRCHWTSADPNAP